MEEKTYRVIGTGNIRHDDVYYEVGDTLCLTDEQAAPLLGIGKIEAMPASVQQTAAISEQRQPDGFPVHTAPAAPTPPVVPAEPAAAVTPPASVTTPPAQPTPQAPALKQPSEAQIDQTIESIA